MRWLVGWSGAVAPADPERDPLRRVRPVGGRLLWPGPDPLWLVGDWRPDEIRTVVLGGPGRRAADQVGTGFPELPGDWEPAESARRAGRDGDAPAPRAPARLAVLGRCGARDEQLRAGLLAAHGGALRHLTTWPGSYTVVLRIGPRTVVLGDLAGVCPVFHTPWSGGTAYASAALPLADLIGALTDPVQLAARLAFPEAADALSDATAYAGVHRVGPGQALTITAGIPLTASYEAHPATVGGPVETTEASATAEVTRSLLEAVRCRVRRPRPAATPDAPRISTDLSGGSASTALTLLAAAVPPQSPPVSANGTPWGGAGGVRAAVPGLPQMRGDGTRDDSTRGDGAAGDGAAQPRGTFRPGDVREAAGRPSAGGPARGPGAAGAAGADQSAAPGLPWEGGADPDPDARAGAHRDAGAGAPRSSEAGTRRNAGQDAQAGADGADGAGTDGIAAGPPPRAPSGAAPSDAGVLRPAREPAGVRQGTPGDRADAEQRLPSAPVFSEARWGDPRTYRTLRTGPGSAAGTLDAAVPLPRSGAVRGSWARGDAGGAPSPAPVLALTSTDAYAAAPPSAAREAELLRTRAFAAARARLEHRVLPGGPESLPYAELADDPLDGPLTDEPGRALVAAARTRARLASAGTDHLTGHGARQVLDGHPARLADLLLDHRGRRLVRPVTALARADGRDRLLQGALGTPVSVLRAARRLARTPYAEGLEEAAVRLLARRFDPPPVQSAGGASVDALAWCVPGPAAGWLTDDALSAVAVRLRLAARRPLADERPGAHRAKLALHRHAAEFRILVQAVEGRGRLHAPFLDTQVVRAARLLPDAARVRPGARQAVLRAVLAGAGITELPTGWGAATPPDAYADAEAVREGMRQAAPGLEALFSAPLLAEAGLIDHKAVLEALRGAVDGRPVPLDGLADLIATEVWLRRRHARRGSCWTGLPVAERRALAGR